MNQLLDIAQTLTSFIPIVMTALTAVALVLLAKAMKERGPLAIPGISIGLLILLPTVTAIVMQVSGVDLSPVARANQSVADAASPYLTLGMFSALAFIAYPIMKRIAVSLVRIVSPGSAMRVIRFVMLLNVALLLLVAFLGGSTVVESLLPWNAFVVTSSVVSDECKSVN